MFRHKKQFGQNFIKDSNVIKKILQNINIKDKSIIEIGTGMGVLTKELIKEAKSVISYEIDKSLIPYHESFKSDNLEIIYEDFFTKKREFDENYILISNPPYNLTKEVLFYFLRSNLKTAVLMFQKEVIDRIMASPNEKLYGSLTLSVNYFCTKKRILTVKKEQFTPIPKVDSAVILLNKKDMLKLDSEDFLTFLQKVFANKRKTLANNLVSSYNLDKEKTNKFLEENFNNSKIRGEALNLESIIKVYHYAKGNN